ncbi:MAG TPA: DUF3306 domain-containing protein [Caldimonas sp.]|jgi:hypothetical protein|nr:DUF3306 domain-containing protein [Caldimonas sp.]HEX2539870.1 DUF3306 domain-containing protein [Caldimonas sp.]
MSADGEGFLARWSRRKAGLAPEAGATVVERRVATPSAGPAATSAPPTGAAGATVQKAGTAQPVQAAGIAAAPLQEPVALPTMDDVASLSGGSDYSRFVQSGVDRNVSNAAMKKLFSDPHFNVMDGLDTYIDDYGKADPIPASMLRRMNQAVSLGLFDADEDPAAPPAVGGTSAQASPDGGPAVAVAQSMPCTPPVPDPAPGLPADDDTDLRLQPDDAPGRRGPEPGPGA